VINVWNIICKLTAAHECDVVPAELQLAPSRGTIMQTERYGYESNDMLCICLPATWRRAGYIHTYRKEITYQKQNTQQ
jgi:hypothetical protein